MARDRQWVNVGRSHDFAVGRMQVIALRGREIGVVRLHSGEIRAILNRCPHKGAPVGRGIVRAACDSSGPGQITFDKSREVLVCPWHGFEFDLRTGRESFWKRPASLRMYPVEEIQGEVFVII